MHPGLARAATKSSQCQSCLWFYSYSFGYYLDKKKLFISQNNRDQVITTDTTITQVRLAHIQSETNLGFA